LPPTSPRNTSPPCSPFSAAQTARRAVTRSNRFSSVRVWTTASSEWVRILRTLPLLSTRLSDSVGVIQLDLFSSRSPVQWCARGSLTIPRIASEPAPAPAPRRKHPSARFRLPPRNHLSTPTLLLTHSTFPTSLPHSPRALVMPVQSLRTLRTSTPNGTARRLNLHHNNIYNNR
jgi:hypothetical protein